MDGKGWNTLYWNNHDQPRAVSRFANDDPKYRVRAAKMLGTTLHMMQGTPFVFEGEELGMANAHYTSIDQYEDLESINAYRELVEEQKLVDGPTMLKYLANISWDNARTPTLTDDHFENIFSEFTSKKENNRQFLKSPFSDEIELESSLARLNGDDRNTVLDGVNDFYKTLNIVDAKYQKYWSNLYADIENSSENPRDQDNLLEAVQDL